MRKWEKDGIVPRELWLKAGAEGLLCCYRARGIWRHGPRLPLRRASCSRNCGAPARSGPGFLIHTDLVATYLLSFGTEAQKRQWLPKMVSGEAIGSLGMTEPHAGSDLEGDPDPRRPRWR